MTEPPIDEHGDPTEVTDRDLDECLHEDTHVEETDYSVGGLPVVCMVCSDCGQNLRILTQKEGTP